jgi:hypothetical protein
MSNVNTVKSILVSLVTPAIKATTKESAMLKFLANILNPAHTFTVQETIEWNALVSEAVLGQHEPFAKQENLDWELLLVEAQLDQAVSIVAANNTVSAVFFQDSWGNWWVTCDANVEGAEAFGPQGCAVRCVPPTDLVHVEDEAEWEVYECPCMGSDEHCHRCSTWETPFVCKGCGHVEWYEGMDDFCKVCHADGTAFTLRGGYEKEVETSIAIGIEDQGQHVDYIHWLENNNLSDKVDAACKGNVDFGDDLPF